MYVCICLGVYMWVSARGRGHSPLWAGIHLVGWCSGVSTAVSPIWSVYARSGFHSLPICAAACIDAQFCVNFQGDERGFEGVLPGRTCYCVLCYMFDVCIRQRQILAVRVAVQACCGYITVCTRVATVLDYTEITTWPYHLVCNSLGPAAVP